MTENEVLQTRIWLKGLLQEYYQRINKLTVPEAVHQREFGFGSFSKKIAIRHRAFKDEVEVLKYLRKEAPAHVNHSLSRYEFPDNPDMQAKMRLATDLIFDIDVGDLNLKHKHEPKWVCEECFIALKDEARKLMEFLTDDFGFDEKELTVNFSGSRGYHVRVHNDKVIQLGESARKEICSYLSLDMDLTELIFEREKRIFGPKPDQHGLKGRIARTVVERVKSPESDIARKDWVAGQITKGNWGSFPKGYGLKKILNYAKSTAVKIPVDSKVTTDPSHMIRMVDTVHGGSLMLAKTVPNLDAFNPMDDCFVFGESEVNVEFIKETPKLDAKGQTWGPYRLGTTKLPKFLAAYYCAKGRCVVR
jgi:DNA primase small subunit